MMKVNILTEGFVSPNVRAFLFPLIFYKNALSEIGVKINILTKLNEEIISCDVLIIESKFHKNRWIKESDKILRELTFYKSKVSKLLYFDTSDSTSLLHPEVLPIVDGYYKNQVLNNKELYSNSMYGNRIFTDYVFRNFNIVDKKPSYSSPVIEKKYLNKIQVYWNSSLANYTLSGKYLMEMYSKLPLKVFLRMPNSCIKEKTIRNNDVSCRINTAYERDTVAWFRKSAKLKLKKWVKTDRLSYNKYWNELMNSKIVVSPFGWGEINYKDYEAFIAGAILVKPDVSHLNTWPALYDNDVTYVPYKWDASNLEEVIIKIIDDYNEKKYIAEKGRVNYFKYLDSKKNESNFCGRFRKIVFG